MTAYQELLARLQREPRSWLVTGCAGFIGSNLAEALLRLDQRVVGLDNFATGLQRNLDQVRASVTAQQWSRFTFHEGDIRKLEDCGRACEAVDYVLHQAALGSVPRSLADPITTNSTNIDGFLNMLVAARDAKVKSFTYAASSSTYGDHPALPKVEDRIGNPLSPYAVTKYVNELYANVFALNYGFATIGLRYFNVFGRRQDPDSTYAAVVPKWIAAMLRSDRVVINGDGETSRDFTYIDNAIQANILAAVAEPTVRNQVYNVAVGDRTTLNELFQLIRGCLTPHGVRPDVEPVYQDFRAGDVRHSQADVGKARRLLGYEPTHRVGQGLSEAMDWYVQALCPSNQTMEHSRKS